MVNGSKWRIANLPFDCTSTKGEAEANARFILQCVNSRAALVEALKPFGEPHGMGDAYVQFHPRLIAAARAALALAKEGEA